MTIQISVLIWTVICFCVLMLILDRLLFRPLLAFMDARKARIQRAMSLEQTQREAAAAREAAQREARELALAEARRLGEARLEEARQRTARQIAQAEEKRSGSISDTQAAIEAEGQAMTERLAGCVEDLARSFAERLTIGL